uniref:Uncharacterized protein n=1 Tax=Ditylenchus dipsaci TaxID=166011 RepID=A0A915DTG6_9BILA
MSDEDYRMDYTLIVKNCQFDWNFLKDERSHKVCQQYLMQCQSNSLSYVLFLILESTLALPQDLLFLQLLKRLLPVLSSKKLLR